MMSRSELLERLSTPEVLDLAAEAQAARFRWNPDPVVTYVVDRNINYTNVCVARCGFCAFYRPPGHGEGWTLPTGEILEKVRRTVEAGGTGILLQGGHNPALPFSFYTELLRTLKRDFPQVHLHAFSAPEIAFFARLYRMEPAEVLDRLVEAGLDSIPGGGAEILSREVRRKMAPGKADVDTWLEIHRLAHARGLFTTATMMFGSIEGPEHILDHLEAIRNLQEETGGFTAFIPWSYQKGGGTPLPKAEVTAVDYLRVLAVSRLALDNIPHLQASWVTQGMKTGQAALHFGADDMGSVMMEENVVSSAGCTFSTNETELRRIISDAGFVPVKRTTGCTPLSTPSPISR